ncbi:substrate-binding domain-containing protein [Duganella sp. FT94W]|uniref:Substrate-binding domain-containing protein n=1 Tax=Duganella lactea TaxID=2692173 RepID=A0ABW9VA81_9BURK|nr:substrate-binding domain-containing protein [Duganella lactea]MYM35662.1 substrate-binding domain-containing protein [Duganella lactea]
MKVSHIGKLATRCLAGVALLSALACWQAAVAAPWTGPVAGPAAQRDKRITFISYDLRNGGITAAYRGLFTAAKELGWQLELVDGHGDHNLIRAAFRGAVAQRIDGIVIGGFDTDILAPELPQARQAGVVLVGWHAAALPGPARPLFTNVSTAPEEVARIAAEFVINSATGPVGVVIFNDDRFPIANVKSGRMAQIIARCAHCKLLAIENIRIEQARASVPDAVARLNRQHGRAWTHNLAINDAYFDAMNVALVSQRRADIRNVAAGDGSAVAISRIGSGMSQQMATVAEPASQQGWQIADEFNRAFAGHPPSGYVSEPIMVTQAFLAALRGADIEADIPYRQAYRRIWQIRGDQAK